MEHTTVVEVEWTEYERGWGQRPDGYTYHATMGIAQKYIDDYWATMPDEAPDEYSRPGPTKLVSVDPIFALLVKDKGTLHVDKSHQTK